MVKILKKYGIDDRELNIIYNLYWKQSATIRVGVEQTEAIKMQQKKYLHWLNTKDVGIVLSDSTERLQSAVSSLQNSKRKQRIRHRH